MDKRDDEHMVLRSIYLPVKDDDVLRELAFREGRSKGDLIRSFIREGLTRSAQAGSTAEGGQTKRKTLSREAVMNELVWRQQEPLLDPLSRSFRKKASTALVTRGAERVDVDHLAMLARQAAERRQESKGGKPRPKAAQHVGRAAAKKK